MAVPTEIDQLGAAWRALASTQPQAGSRLIVLMSGEAYEVRAGRHFPGNEETLLVGFSGVAQPAPQDLPEGVGFSVTIASVASGTPRQWLALKRQQAGNRELFTRMANDLVSALRHREAASGPTLLRAFLRRIVAWQEFMRHRPAGVLSPRDELGLFGELEMLVSLLDAGVTVSRAVAAWTGPLRGIHDFRFEPGAIEVKTTSADSGFRASISSLDQLNVAHGSPLFLAAMRLGVTSGGMTLPERVHSARELIDSNVEVLEEFDLRLLRTGYLSAAAEHYTRRFVCRDARYLAVADGFPCLTRANVPSPVVFARYELDLDQITAGDVSLDDVLLQLGAIDG